MMDLTEILSYIIVLVLITGAFLDSYTTAGNIISAGQEQNHFVRKYMRRFGINRMIWTVFVIKLIIISLSWYLFAFNGTMFYRIVFIVAGGIVSLIQLAVVHTNHTGNFNTISIMVNRFYNRKG
jgi:hypothetical protein